MGRKVSITLFFVLALQLVQAQTGPGKYWISFSDKSNTPYSVSSPEEFLSQRAIDRRERQNIPITTQDLPVDPEYVDSILASGSFRLMHRSKWFNGITIETTDTLALDSLSSISFVMHVKSVRKLKGPKPPVVKEKEPVALKASAPNDYYHTMYGAGFNQIHMLRGHLLHADGYRGEGMQIAVLDAGFRHFDRLRATESLRESGRFLGGWNFANNSDTIFNYSNHGTYVLSTMAGKLDGKFQGTAPEASYYLLVTEDVTGENIVEEDNWVAGAEFADSAGADILNTSLGYTTFEDSTVDHRYDDLDGNTTRITIGSDIAASKGMLVVNSAGNSGNNPWFYIGAPADGDSVLAVGAVDSLGITAGFSSHGPSFDGRVKPNVVAQGALAVVCDLDTGVLQANGTSFSGPILAGAAACLWQAHPELTAWEIHQAIERSADRYLNPDADYGYGIPNLYQAHLDLSGRSFDPSPTIYPNPSTDYFNLVFEIPAAAQAEIRIYDNMGRLVAQRQTEELESGWCHVRVGEDFLQLSDGLYYVQLSVGELTWEMPLVKLDP